MHAPLHIRPLITLLVSLCAGIAQAQPAPSNYEPATGQAGKDVVWVPTSQALVDRMLDMAKATPSDYVIDLGSGDGRTVITAARRGMRALGIEYNPDLVEVSKRNAQKEGMSDRATFARADLFETDFSEATVITMFLLTDINAKLRPKLLGLRPGTRIVSNTFRMGEWSWDESTSVGEKEGCVSYCTAYLWIVPANAAGTWEWPQGELVLKQEFQILSGQLQVDGKPMPITSGRVTGDQLAFKVGGIDYLGRLVGNRIEGTSAGSVGAWTATRTSAPSPAVVPADR